MQLYCTVLNGWDLKEPKTFNSVADAFEVLHGGLGLNIVSDDIGEYSNLGLQLFIRMFRTDLGQGQLGIGAHWNVSNGLNGGGLIPADLGDISVPTGEI